MKRVPPNFHFIIHHHYDLHHRSHFPHLLPTQRLIFTDPRIVRLSTIHKLHARKKASRLFRWRETEKWKSWKRAFRLSIGHVSMANRRERDRAIGSGERGKGGHRAHLWHHNPSFCVRAEKRDSAEPAKSQQQLPRRTFAMEHVGNRRIELFAYDSYNREISAVRLPGNR